MRIPAVTLLLLLSAISFARIGLPAQATIDAMDEAGLLSAEEFSLDTVIYDDLLFSLGGEFTAGGQNFELLGEAVGFATGFREQISGPVAGFLEANLEGLIQAEAAVVPVEGSYLLELDLEQDDAGATLISWSFGLRELDPALFPPARHALGADADSARVVIREFADLQCPHCSTFALTVLPQLSELLEEDEGIRLEFHHLPLVTIHANAVPAAEATECVVAANEPGSFWVYSEHVFERMQAWQQLPETGPYFISLAEELELNTDGVAECLSEREHLAYIMDSADHAVQQLGLNGTPSVFVDGFQVAGWNRLDSYLELIALIQARSTAP